MRKKSLLIVVCSLALVLALGVTSAFASSAAEKAESSGMFGAPGGHFGRMFQGTKDLPEGFPEDMQAKIEDLPADVQAEMEERQAEMQAKMEERQAEMEARRQECQAQWDALTEEEKQEVYNLQRQMLQTQQQLIDKYLELGLIEADAAEKMQTMLEEQSLALENGEMSCPPFPGFEFRKGR